MSYDCRLWPNGTEVSRYNEEEVILSGYHIPPGTHIDLNPSVHFRDPELFPDPNAHNPDRWLRDGQAQDGVATNTFPFFGISPPINGRRCQNSSYPRRIGLT